VIDKRMRQPVSNADIARIFARYSTLLEIEGANSFRVRAYQNAARLIQGLPKSIPEMLAEGADLTELEGIGEDLAGKIGEIVTTRHLGVLEEIEKRMPAPQRRGVHMARPANMLCLDPRQKPCQCGGS
jgi:DNA polymerase (family 10)